MMHGGCSSAGCYAITDEQIAEIYALARESFYGNQRSFQIQAYPFRMTPLNLVKHLGNPNIPFWRMLKEGNDHFEVTHLEPKVDVCERRYLFDAEPIDASASATTAVPLALNPVGWCPAYEVPHKIALAVAEKNRRDEAQIAELVSRGTSMVPVQTSRHGDPQPMFRTRPLASDGIDVD